MKKGLASQTNFCEIDEMKSIWLQPDPRQTSNFFRASPSTDRRLIAAAGPHARRRFRTVALACLAALAVLAAFLLFGGCQAGTTGTFRPIDPVVEHTITNAIGAVTHTAAPMLPFPWSTVFEAAGGAALTLLAAWQTITHRQVSKNTIAIANGNQKGS